MTIQEAIEKAIEGGWEKDGFVCQGELIGVEEIALLDPLFWQALGKAMGWETRITFYNSFIGGKENNDPWRLEMHRFIDHLAEGKTIESYFETL